MYGAWCLRLMRSGLRIGGWRYAACDGDRAMVGFAALTATLR